MHIRTQLHVGSNTLSGHVKLGENLKEEYFDNQYWCSFAWMKYRKFSSHIFLVSNLSSKELKLLVKWTLISIKETRLIYRSMTYDGSLTNLTVFTFFSANFLLGTILSHGFLILWKNRKKYFFLKSFTCN